MDEGAGDLLVDGQVAMKNKKSPHSDIDVLLNEGLLCLVLSVYVAMLIISVNTCLPSTVADKVVKLMPGKQDQVGNNKVYCNSVQKPEIEDMHKENKVGVV